MTRTKLVALLLALTLAGAACGSDDDPAVAPDEDAEQTTTTEATTTTADDMERPPFEGEAADVEVAYETFFSATASTEDRAARIEATAVTEAITTAAAETAGEDASTADVTGVSVISEDVARVEYTLTVGSLVLENQIGFAVKQEGTWKVALSTLCGLLQIRGAPDECQQVEPPPGT